MISPNTILRERYRIIHQLGHGGMGAVYQAMDENLSCVVAVKETFATTEEQRRAFRREAELLANLSHPTLPRVTDHFTQGEGQFLVMQFVPGHDLAELLELREQPFAVAKVLDWADQILDALEELHSSKPSIIHRDIKPSNLKVTPRGRILLLDFGLAKGAAGQMSTADADSHGKSIYGYTPNYAPIEQVRGAGTDPRSDLYSLAATLWTLLTGRVPPDAVTRMAEKEEGNLDPLRLAHELNSQVPPAVSAAVNRAMAVNRHQRCASAEEFRQVLHEAREAKFESPTLAMDEARVAEAISRPASDSLEPTIRTPDPERVPAQPPLGSTIRPPESQVVKLASSEPQVPTLRVDSPPVVDTLEISVSSPTAPRPIEDYKQRESGKRVVMIAASVLVLAIVTIAVVVWQPWATSTTNNTTNSTTNLSLSNNQTNSVSTNSQQSMTAPAGMVYIPGGTFTMGRNDGDEYERPTHQVTVKPFFIDTYEVTNEVYEKFVKATNHKVPQTWTNGTYAAADARKPVTGVTWDDANEYAKWAGKRLPTEEEWEFAARGSDGRRYPWGNDWHRGLANANSTADGMADVGAYRGSSPFGVFDMTGNAWEWTRDDMTAYPGGKLPEQPASGTKVLRGGSFKSNKDQARVTYRLGWRANEEASYAETGFRCVKDVNVSSPQK